MLDNYDSFTFNLVQLFGVLGVDMVVRRNDALTVDDVADLAPRAIVISPGPCTPDEAGISMGLIERFLGKVPILGVCLGHQAIAQQLGGDVVRAPRLVHGKTSPIFHDGRGIYEGIENPLEATRYHSLIVARETLPACLEVSAKTWEDEIMGFRHRETLCVGVQYHPESVLTTAGQRLMANFLRAVDAFWAARAEAA